MVKNDFFSFFQEGYQNVPNFSTNVNKTVFFEFFFQKKQNLLTFLILKVTMGCIQKAEPPKRRSLHKAVMICYGVFNIKGRDVLHTKGGTPKKAEPPQGGAPMLWCF